MTKHIRRISSVAAVITLGFAAGGEETAFAQNRNVGIRTSHGNRTEIRWSEGGRTVWTRSEGNVEFTDDDRDVRRISPGGHLSIEERGWGSTDRRMEFAGLANGVVQRTYFENGRATTLDGQARAWANGMILKLVREHAVGAEARARRILARGGVSGMLNEIEQIRSSSAKRIYYNVLLEKGRLGANDLTRVLSSIGRDIPSSSDKAAVLVRGVERLDLARPRVRDAWIAAAGSIPSSSEHRRVLSAALRQRSVSKPMVLEVLRAVEGIPSDSEKTAVLLEIPEAQLRDAQVASAYVTALQSIRSDSNYRRAASRVMQQRTR